MCAEPLADLGRRSAADDAPLLHDRNLVCKRKRLLKAMLRQDDRRAKLPVELAEHGEKVRGRNGVELAGRLVEDEHLWLHDHDCCEVQ